MTDQIYIFYSSETEPDIIRYYGDVLSYLHTIKEKVTIVDVFEKPEIAKKNNIFITPTVLFKKGKKIKEYVGILDGLKDTLSSDILGRSFLHKLSYREGREFAANKDLKSKKVNDIEKILFNKLKKSNIDSIQIKTFDKKNKIVKIILKFKKQVSAKTIDHDISPFLSGIFMEIFKKSVYAKIIGSLKKKDDTINIEIK